VVFYNIANGDQDTTAPLAHTNGYVSRLYNSPENSPSYVSNLEKCVNFIALFKFTESGFNNGKLNGAFLPPK